MMTEKDVNLMSESNTRLLQVGIRIFMWLVLCSAIFSESGLNVNIGVPIINVISNNFADFLFWFNVALFLLTSMMIMGFSSKVGDEIVQNGVDALVKEHGMEKTSKTIAFRKWSFMFITIPFIIALIMFGWVGTALVWILWYGTLLTIGSKQRAYFNEKYASQLTEG